MTEKHVLFDSKVDIVNTPTNWETPTTPDLQGSSSVPSSGDLGWPLVSLAKGSSTGCSRLGLQARSSTTQRGSSNYNYGYSAGERPDKLGLLLFSNEDLGKDDGWSSCAWVHDPQRRWIVACWTCIALLSLLILAVLAMILVFCVIIPKSPYLEVPDEAILVQSLNVTPIGALLLNASSMQRGVAPVGQMTARFSAHFTLQLVAKNPNRVATDYTSSSFSVAYGDTVVSESTVAAFSQKAHGRTQMKPVVLIADHVNFSHQNALSLLTDANLNDSISLQIHGRVQSQLRILDFPTPPVLIKLWCSVKIRVKELQVTEQQCHISISKVIR